MEVDAPFSILHAFQNSFRWRGLILLKKFLLASLNMKLTLLRSWLYIFGSRREDQSVASINSHALSQSAWLYLQTTQAFTGLWVDLKDRLTESPRWSELDKAGIGEQQSIRCRFETNNRSIVLAVPLWWTCIWSRTVCVNECVDITVQSLLYKGCELDDDSYINVKVTDNDKVFKLGTINWFKIIIRQFVWQGSSWTRGTVEHRYTYSGRQDIVLQD